MCVMFFSASFFVHYSVLCVQCNFGNKVSMLVWPSILYMPPVNIHISGVVGKY